MSGIDTSHDDEFARHRDRLFGLAYRMTGSVADAEDAVQEAWLRWRRTERTSVRNPEAWLVSVVTRLTIDRLRSAQVRREQYVGPWLPEPLVGGPLVDTEPEAAAEMADSLTFAFLVLLDELNPTERAVFLLREVFGYGYDEIADSVGRSAEACRQLVSRTRRRLDGDLVELRRADPTHERRMVGDMVTALLDGDVDRLLDLLSPDVVFLSDGGANRHAGRRPIAGPDRVARLLVNLAKRTPPGSGLEFVRANGSPAILVTEDGEPDYVMAVEFAPDGRIRRLFAQVNPDKLHHLR
jgi:RNA polymerase sigma-70 factor (ECF subfamily)